MESPLRLGGALFALEAARSVPRRKGSQPPENIRGPRPPDHDWFQLARSGSVRPRSRCQIHYLVNRLREYLISLGVLKQLLGYNGKSWIQWMDDPRIPGWSYLLYPLFWMNEVATSTWCHWKEIRGIIDQNWGIVDGLTETLSWNKGWIIP